MVPPVIIIYSLISCTRMNISYQDEKNKIYCGDCLEVLKSLPDCCVDSIITDPPYGLEFMGKDWDAPWKSSGNPASAGFSAGGYTKSNGYINRQTPAFGRVWRNKRCTKCGHIASGGSPCTCPAPEWMVEHGDVAAPMLAFQVWMNERFIECFRVLKPGGYVLAFGGSRTYHRLASAIEDAGFEIRDQIMWVYGSGFPKNLDVSKAIDKYYGVEREILGSRLSRQPTGNAYAQDKWTKEHGKPREISITIPYTDEAKKWDGWGTALKPAHEPIVVARKPLVGTVVENVLKYNTGAINIDDSRVPIGEELDFSKIHNQSSDSAGMNGIGRSGFRSDHSQPTWNSKGRWPANLIHDGSETVMDEFAKYGDVPTPARFFYCAKTSKTDRNEGLDDCAPTTTDDGRNTPIDNPYLRGKTLRNNHHPTVKPTKLMRYLCRMVTPPHGVVLDIFMGSGSTGKAATLEGFQFIGIDLNEEYCEIARKRITMAIKQKETEVNDGVTKNTIIKSEKKVKEAGFSLF